MKTVMKPFMVQENSRNLSVLESCGSGASRFLLRGFWQVDGFMTETMKGLMIRSTA
jgi:hypothetical protein